MELRFVAHGTPVTQGSVNAYPTKGGRGVRVVSKTPELIEWRETMRHMAELAAGENWETQDGPASVILNFWLPRPVSAPKTKDIYPSTGKDIDKLVRACLDALTSAGIWTDDSRAVSLNVNKYYVVGPHLPKIYNPDVHKTSPGVEVAILWLAGEAFPLG